MVIVSGTLDVNPEKHDEAVAAFQAAAAATERDDAGCITYRFYEDVSQPNRFLVYEEWESAESLAAHGKAAHMAVFGAAIGPTLAGKPNIRRFDNANEVPLNS